MDIPGAPIAAPEPTDFASMITELEAATEKIKSLAAERDSLKKEKADLAGKFRAALDNFLQVLAPVQA